MQQPKLARSGVSLIHVPIAFEPGHAEITQSVGILSVIKSLGLFELGSMGARPIPELDSLGDGLLTLSGRTGFNAFRGTNLDEVLSDRGGDAHPSGRSVDSGMHRFDRADRI